MRNTLLGLMLLATAGLGNAAIKNPDTFIHLTIGDPESLDPVWAYDAPSNLFIANIYEYLLAFPGSGITPKDLVGRLSEKVPTLQNGLLSKDGLTYRFPLRKGVKFQDGSALTPEDVRYSLLRFMLIDRDGGPSSLLLDPILGVESTRGPDGKLIEGIYERAAKAVGLDGNVLVVRLHKPFAPFLGVLTGYGAIVSKAWCVKNGQWDGTAETLARHNNPKRESSHLLDHANGTGPFSLERFDKATKEVVLVRHEGYWRGPAKLKRVYVKVIDEFATRKLKIQAGDADTIYGPQMYFPQLEGLPGVEAIDGLQNLERGTILLFTFQVNPTGNTNLGSGKLDGDGIPSDFFSDKNVRKGFAFSIDYDGYVRDILRGKGRQAVSFIPPGLVGYKADLPKYSFDPKKAAEHFQKAWGGKAWEKGFKFTLVYNAGSAPAQTLSNMIKKNIEALNAKFKIDVRSLQWSTFLDQTQAKKVPLTLGAWGADYPDAHNFAFPFVHSKGYFPGKQGYKNPEADALVEEAAGELDLKRREELYVKLQKLIYEEVPHINIAEGVRYRTQRSWVKGFVHNPIFPESPYGSYFYDIRKEE